MNMPSPNDLLRTREMSIIDYANEKLHKVKYTKARSMALYGSRILPIPIPLQPTETREGYETRVVERLYRERSLTLKKVRMDANWERRLRFAFARTEVRAYFLRLANHAKTEPIVKTEDFTTPVVIGVKRERSDHDECPCRRKLKSEAEDDMNDGVRPASPTTV